MNNFDEWKNGFEDGYKFCEWLSQQPIGTKSTFFPKQEGVYRNGFAEGTISGGHKFNVSWRFTNEINTVVKSS